MDKDIVRMKSLYMREHPFRSQDEVDEIFKPRVFAASHPQLVDITALNKAADVLSPVDQQKGLRRNDIDVFTDPNSVPAVKQAIRENLDSLRLTPEEMNDLSDEEIEKLIPTRYANGYTFTDMYRDYARGVVDEFVKSQEKLEADENADNS